ncbi:MAG: FMN-binding protein [Myxococcota bacterium]
MTLLVATGVQAEVFHSKESALRLAFPDADTVTPRNFFISDAQKAEAEALGGAALESRMVTCYVGARAGQILGYAFIDTHLVRTLPETLMVVLAPDGRVRATHLLAFHEPPEYQPPRRWLRQFAERRLGPSVRLGADIVAIAGSSMTSEAVTAGIRRVLALYEVLLRPSGGARAGGVRPGA